MPLFYMCHPFLDVMSHACPFHPFCIQTLSDVEYGIIDLKYIDLNTSLSHFCTSGGQSMRHVKSSARLNS